MKFTNLALVLGAAFLTTACVDGTTDNTGCDTATGEGCDTDEDTDIVDLTPTFNVGAWTGGWADFVDCGTAGKVNLMAETNNWGGNVAVYISQTTVYGEFIAWEEAHTLEETSASTDNDGDGFSVYERELTTGASLETQDADVSTLWVCGNTDPSMDPTAAKLQTSFALAVWDVGASASDAPTDCIYFGQDPNELINDGYTGGTGTDGSGRTLPTWLTSSACTVVN